MPVDVKSGYAPREMEPSHVTGGFVHDLFLYADEDDFLAGTVPFIRGGLAAGEPVLVAVRSAKIDLLRDTLGDDADAAGFADTGEIGRNPAHMIPVWRQFVNEHASPQRRLWAIGEAVWPGRRPAELIEWHRHEALLNLAFGDGPAWSLLCLYDAGALEAATVQEAHRTHPFVRRGGTREPNDRYDPHATATARLDDPLPEPATRPRQVPFTPGDLARLRRLVSRQAATLGLDRVRAGDLTAAANEAAANSLRHGGGSGVLRLWRDDHAVVCEIRDHGHIDEPLVDRRRPTPHQVGGRGLWLANQLCDLVQMRSFATGSAVRLHMWHG